MGMNGDERFNARGGRRGQRFCLIILCLMVLCVSFSFSMRSARLLEESLLPRVEDQADEDERVLQLQARVHQQEQTLQQQQTAIQELRQTMETKYNATQEMLQTILQTVSATATPAIKNRGDSLPANDISMSNPAPKKHVKINGTMKLNPEYARWKKGEMRDLAVGKGGVTIPKKDRAKTEKVVDITTFIRINTCKQKKVMLVNPDPSWSVNYTFQTCQPKPEFDWTVECTGSSCGDTHERQWKIDGVTLDCRSFKRQMTPELAQQFRSLAEAFHETLMKNGTDYAIVSGTTIGYLRHNGSFIPWDDDFDLAIRKKDAPHIPALFNNTPYCTTAFWGGLKFHKCSSPNAGNYPWKYPFIDVFYSNTGIRGKKPYPEDILFPSRPVLFEGLELRGPKDIETHLRLQYGSDPRKTCVANRYDHKREKSLGALSAAPTKPCSDVLTACGYRSDQTVTSEQKIR